MTFIYHLLALTLAVVIDRLIGDPKTKLHPVVLIGKLIALLEQQLNVGRCKKAKGVLLLVLVILTVSILSTLLVSLAYYVHVAIGMMVEGFLISFAIASRSLQEAARDVHAPLMRNDLPESRLKLSYIVGRDTNHLGEEGIVRGTVETVAENTSDGITSPLFFALLGGAPLALLYRAVNTCDSMVGYRNEKFRAFGWASARFDDVLNYIPSRITGLLMVLVNKTSPFLSKKNCFSLLMSDAGKHSSPNSGWTEAAMATLLGIELGGTNRYHGVFEERARLGRSFQPLTKNHIIDAIVVMNKTVFAFVIFLWLIGGIIYAIT